MTGSDMSSHFRKIIDGYSHDCCLIDPSVLLKTYSEHAFIFVEPHPDDTVLSAGGLLCLLDRALSIASSDQRIYNITAVSGHHSVDTTFIERLTDKHTQYILDEYRTVFKMYRDRCDHEDEKEISAIKEYYDECLKNNETLQGDVKDNKIFEAVLKGGLRSCIENKYALECVMGKERIRRYNAFLPFYDSCAGFTPALEHPLNIFAMKNIIRSIMVASGKKKAVVFIDNSQDPRGTHQRVRSIVNKTLLQLIERNEMCDVICCMMHGPWQDIIVNENEAAQAVVFGDDIMRKKCEAFGYCGSQIEALISAGENTRFDDRVKERNAAYAKGLKEYHKDLKEGYAEIFFCNDFLNTEGRFDKGVFIDYITQIEGGLQ